MKASFLKRLSALLLAVLMMLSLLTFAFAEGEGEDGELPPTEEQEIIPLNEGTDVECTHVAGEATVVVAATCTEAGSSTATCVLCGEVLTVEIPATGHSHGEGVVTTKATCTEAGEMTFSCACGDSYTETIPAGHSYGEATVVNATCTKAGSSTATCTGCGELLTVEIPATGHSYTENVTKAANCTEAGQKTLSCVCGDVQTVEIPAAHTPGEPVVVAATCTTDGSITVSCTVEGCGALISTETISAGHTYENGVCTACGEAEPVPCSWRPDCAAEEHTAECIKGNVDKATALFDALLNEIALSDTITDELRNSVNSRMYSLLELEYYHRDAWSKRPGFEVYQMDVWNVIAEKLTLLVNELPAADTVTAENLDAVKAKYDKLQLLDEAYREVWYPGTGRDMELYNVLNADGNYEKIAQVIANSVLMTDTSTSVAEAGGTQYPTLQEAMNNVADGGTVTLLDGITIDGETYTIADGKTVTLNMAGKTINVTDNKTSGNYELFYIYGQLTVTGSGTITLTATNNRAWDALSAIFHNRGGVLNIENGTFTHNGGTDMAYVIDNSGNYYGDATTNISGGTFSSTYTAIRNRMEQNSHGSSGKAILNVSGGSISGTTSAIWAQAASTSETSPATGEINITAGNVGLINTARSSGAECMTTISGGTVAAFKGESGELTVTDGTISGTVTIMTATGEETQYAVTSDGKYVTAVARLGETNYATLQEAVNAAKSGETVTLLHNSDETVELPSGVALNKGNFTADNVTVAPSPVAQVGETPYTSLQEAINNANDDTVTLLDSISLTEGVTIPAGSVVTLELNGKTISRNTEAAASSAAITNNGTLTVQDSLGGGKITAFAANPDTAEIPYYANNTITNCGVLKLLGGTIENSTSDAARAAYPIDNNSTVRDAIVYIQDGTVTGRGAIRQFANSTTNKNEVYITGGTVTGTSYGIWAQNPNASENKATLNISSGTVAKVLLSPSANFDISISGGTVSDVAIWSADANNPDRNPSGFITGGTFGTNSIDESFLAKGYTLEPNGSGYSPVLTDPEAKIGETPYATLAEAVDAANKAGGDVTITVQKDVILDAPLNITGTVKLNLNGKTISQEKVCTEHYGMINNSGSLTITGDGKISFKDTGAGDPAFGWGSYTIVNRGNLVVENGTIENTSAQNPTTPGSTVVHMYCAIQQSGGTTTINDGSIVNNTYRSVRINSGHLLINGGNFVGQVWLQPNQGNASIEVNNGTFAPSGVDGSSIFLTNEGEGHGVSSAAIKGGTFNTKIGATNATALGGIITGGNFTEAAKNGTNTALLATGYSFELNTDGTYSPVSSNEASIGGDLYSTFEKAIEAANNSSQEVTIKLLKDVELDNDLVISKSITINPNGFKMTFANGKHIKIATDAPAGTTLTINLDFKTCEDHFKALAPGLCVTEGSIKIQNHIEGTPATCTSGAICTTCAQPMGDPIPHSYTYTGSGDTITETCTNGCNHSATAKLERDPAVSAVYTGKKIEALKVVYSDNWKAAKDLAITYSDNEDIGKNATGTITKTFDTDKTATATATFEITRAAYTMTPNNLRYVRGSGYSLSFTTNVPYNTANALKTLTIYRANGTLVMNVPVNQVAVSANSNGMTVITIPGIVMNALEALNYELVAEFEYGDARTPFRVLLPFIFPMTGDEANVILLATISLVALGGVTAIVLSMRKKQYKGRH